MEAALETEHFDFLVSKEVCMFKKAEEVLGGGYNTPSSLVVQSTETRCCRQQSLGWGCGKQARLPEGIGIAALKTLDLFPNPSRTMVPVIFGKESQTFTSDYHSW